MVCRFDPKPMEHENDPQPTTPKYMGDDHHGNSRVIIARATECAFVLGRGSRTACPRTQQRCVVDCAHIGHAMVPPTRQLLLGAFLFTVQRSNAFHAPVLSSLALRQRQGSQGLFKMMSTSPTAGSSPMQETIESRLSRAFTPVHLEVINESHMHAGPAKESHFKVCCHGSLSTHYAALC